MARNKIWLGILFWAIAIVGLIAPIGVWFFINAKEYFAEDTSGDMFIGLVIGLIFVVIMLAGALKEIDKRVTTVFSLAIFAAIFWFLDPIIDDIMMITICALVGYVIYIPTSAIGKRNLKHYNAYKDESMRVQARKEAEEMAIHL